MVFTLKGKGMKEELKQRELYTPDECFSLENKNAVIIGGAGKMAASFSRALLSAGCRSLVIADIDSTGARKAVKDLQKRFKGKHIYAYKYDASSEIDAVRFSEFLRNKVKKIDVLIYAVMAKPKDYYAALPEYKASLWNKALKANLSGAFLSTQKLLPLLNPSASIIFISSIYGIRSPDPRVYRDVKSNIYGGKYPLSSPVVYSVSKAGLIGLARYLAVYLAEKNIRVNVLVPGGIYDRQDENFYREYVKRVPMKRMAVASDYNGAVLFLASDTSRYMTGQLLIVDGGWSVW